MKSLWISSASAVLVLLVTSCAAVEEDEVDQRFGEAVEEEEEREVEVRQLVEEEIIVEKEIPTIVRREEVADINRMDPEHFVALGFSEDMAENIVTYREEEGPFESREDLQDVPGMSPEAYSQHEDQLGVRVLAE